MTVTPKLTESVMLCRGCGLYFRGLSNFDKHQRDEYGPVHKPKDGPRHVCLPPEHVGLTWRPEKGYWSSAPMTDEQREKAAAGWA